MDSKMIDFALCQIGEANPLLSLPDQDLRCFQYRLYLGSSYFFRNLLRKYWQKLGKYWPFFIGNEADIRW